MPVERLFPQFLQGAAEAMPALGNFSWTGRITDAPVDFGERATRVVGNAAGFLGLMGAGTLAGLNPLLTMGAIGALQAGTAKERAVRAATMPLTAVAVGPIARAMGGMVPSPEAAGFLRNTMLSGARVAAVELPGAAVGATIQPLANKQILEALGEKQPDIQWDDAASSFAEQYIAGILTHGMQVGGKDYRQAVLDQAMAASRLGVPSDPSRLGAISDPSTFPRLSDYQSKAIANKINRVAAVIRKPIEQESALISSRTKLSEQDAELIAIKQAEYIDSFVEEWNKQNPSQEIEAPWNSWQNRQHSLTPAQYLAAYGQSSIIRKLVTGTFIRQPSLEPGPEYAPLSEGMPSRPYGTGLPEVNPATAVPVVTPGPRVVPPLLSPEERAQAKSDLPATRPSVMSFEEESALKANEARRAEQAAYDALPMEEKIRLADALKQETNRPAAPPLSIEERLNELSVAAGDEWMLPHIKVADEIEANYPRHLLEKPLTPEELKQSDKLGVLLPARPGEPPRSMHPDALAMKLRREMEGHFPRPIESSESWNGRTAAETDEIFKEISEAVPKWIDSRDNGGLKGRRFSSFEEFMAALAEGPEPIMANTAYPELTNKDVISLLRWRSTFGGAAKTDAELTPTLSTEQKITSGLWTREDAPEVKHDIQRPPEEDLQEYNTRRFIEALNIAFGKKSRRGGRYLSRYTDSEGNVKKRWINLPKEVLTKRVEFEGRTVDVPILELVDFIRTYGVVPAGRKTKDGRPFTRQQKLFMQSEEEIAGAKDSDLYNERTWTGNRPEFRPKSADEFDEYGGTQEPFPRESDIYLKRHQRLAYDRAHYPRRVAASKRAITAFDKKHKEVYSRTFRISNSTTGTGGSGKKIPAAMRGKSFDGKPESDMSNTKPGKYGWLGNPFKWEGNGGPKGVSREQAVAQFEEFFLDKVETDEAFRNAVLNLRGREVFYYQGDVEGSHVKVIQKWLLDHNGGGELPTGRPGFPQDPAFAKKPSALTPRRITVRKPSWEDIDESRKAAIYKNERGEYEIDNEFASLVIPSMKYAGIKIKLDPDTGKALFKADGVTPEFAPENAPLGVAFEAQPKTGLFKPVWHSAMWKSKEGYEQRFPTVTFTSGNRPVGADRIGIDVDAVTASITPDRKAKTPAKTTIAKIRETAEWPQSSKPLGGTQLIDLEAVMSGGRVQEAAFLKKLGQGTDLIEKLDPAKSIDGDAMSIPKMFRAGHYFNLDDVPDTEYGTRFRNQINQDGIRYLDEEINKYLTDPNEGADNLKYFFDQIQNVLANNDAPGVPSKVAEIAVPGSGQTTGKPAHDLATTLATSLKVTGSISGITDNPDFQKLPLRTQVDVIDAISNAIIPEGQAGGNVGSRAMFDTPKMVKQPDGSVAPKMIKLAYGIAHSTIFPKHQLPVGTYHGTSEQQFAKIRSATIEAAARGTPVPEYAKHMNVASYYAPSHRPYIRIPEHSTITDAKESISYTPAFDTLPKYTPGQKTMTYAGVGSRETPAAQQQIMEKVAAYLAKLGYTLNSGGAEGADSAFERGVGATGKKNIFPGNVPASKKAKDIALEIHPNPEAIRYNARDYNLMARNTYQVFGENLDSPVDFVLAWTPDGLESSESRSIKSGGTGQAIDMASRKGIPVINLANPGWESKLREVLGLPQSQSVVPQQQPPARTTTTAQPKPFKVIEYPYDRWTPESISLGLPGFIKPIYVFGDNLEGTGRGGQAVIRGHADAYGIPTKRSPKTSKDAYFGNPANEQQEAAAITAAVDRIIDLAQATGRPVVLPKAGLGTGLAKLAQKSPRLFAHLQSEIARLKAAQEGTK